MEEITENSTLSTFKNYYVYNGYGNLSYVFIKARGMFALYDVSEKEIYDTFPTKDLPYNVKKFINAGATILADSKTVELTLVDTDVKKLKNVIQKLSGCSCKAKKTTPRKIYRRK